MTADEEHKIAITRAAEVLAQVKESEASIQRKAVPIYAESDPTKVIGERPATLSARGHQRQNNSLNKNQITMKVEIGMRFSVHWVGHEDCYRGRLYEALSITRDCQCAHPRVWLHKTQNSTPIHIHIRAKRIDMAEPGDCQFGFVDEDLRDIYDPQTYHLQIEATPKPIQLTIF